ncbi:hypothetical protein K501DRAFT_266196 [Backusella circina FSU 941]|nr:hypothetical protein K501DRAFT_266196 [Backusella circina FSU 941]
MFIFTHHRNGNYVGRPFHPSPNPRSGTRERANLPLGHILTYNGRDCFVTLHVINVGDYRRDFQDSRQSSNSYRRFSGHNTNSHSKTSMNLMKLTCSGAFLSREGVIFTVQRTWLIPLVHLFNQKIIITIIVSRDPLKIKSTVDLLILFIQLKCKIQG